MCAYKTVRTKFEIWGLQTRVESWGQKAIRDILLLAHKQVYCWTDAWYDQTYESIVEYERETYAKTNELIKGNQINQVTIRANNNQLEEGEKNVAEFG